MKIYNSKTSQVEIFKPLKANHVSMYVCGPTVYGDAHIGNARPIVVFDTLRRCFEALGYTVDFVSNYTDVDDKIIDKAIQEGVSETVITERYIQAYEQVRLALNTQDLKASPKVTDTIERIVAFIKQLIDQDFAYEIEGDVYFRVEKAASYGEISKQRLDDLLAGARIETQAKKENPLDFVLWKKTDLGIQWPSPWGLGRPGWHTECVVMIDDHFHNMIDIHGGGMDLKFPHHENEVAQARACLDHPLANYWMHNGMLNIDGEKMSKSLGNVMLAKDVIELLGSNVVRWLMLSVNYRAPLNISEEIIETAKTEILKIQTALKTTEIKAQLLQLNLNTNNTHPLYDAFLEAMQDDLNTPNAMKIIFDTVKALNAALRQKDQDESLAQLYQSLQKMLWVMGIVFNKTQLDEHQVQLYEQWNQAKAAKDFEAADRVRQLLIDQNILV
jgi:cysteinyl-tRNA synthetase